MTSSKIPFEYTHLSPVYTIQPVVKPRLSNRFDKRLYRVYSRLSNGLYNPV